MGIGDGGKLELQLQAGAPHYGCLSLMATCVLPNTSLSRMGRAGQRTQAAGKTRALLLD